MHKKIHVKTKNKICAAVLVFVLAGSLTAGACAVPNVYAKTEAEKKRDAYKKKLKAKNSDIANIKDSQSDVKDSITAAAARMKTLLSKQEQLKSDIKDKQNEVEQANKKLEEAKEEEQNQYDAMKLRIQYLYENSTDNSICEFRLQGHGEIHDVHGIRVQVVLKGGVHGDGVGVHVELLGDQCTQLFKNHN